MLLQISSCQYIMYIFQFKDIPIQFSKSLTANSFFPCPTMKTDWEVESGGWYTLLDAVNSQDVRHLPGQHQICRIGCKRTEPDKAWIWMRPQRRGKNKCIGILLNHRLSSRVVHDLTLHVGLGWWRDMCNVLPGHIWEHVRFSLFFLTLRCWENLFIMYFTGY